MVGDLVRKRNRRGEGDVNIALSGKKGVELFWAVLEEGLFDILGCCRKEQGKRCYEGNNEICHLKNDNIAVKKRKIEN